MSIPSYVQVTFGTATNLDGSTITQEQIQGIEQYLNSPGSGPSNTESFSDFTDNALYYNPPALKDGMQYVLYSGYGNEAKATSYVDSSNGGAGTIIQTSYGQFIANNNASYP